MAMQDIRNMIANHSTALVCTAATCNIHHNLFVGFDVAIEASSSVHMELNENIADTDISIFMTDIHSPAIVAGLEMDSFLTHGINHEQPDVGSVSTGPDGDCQLNMGAGAGGDFDVGDPVYVNLTKTLNCNGLAFVEAKGSTMGADWIEIEDTPPAPPANVGAAWTAGSPVMSLNSVVGVWPGQTVSCTGTCTGFPSGATVVDVSKYTPFNSSARPYRIVLDTIASASGTSVSGVGFTNPSSTESGNVSLEPGQRPASGASAAGTASYGWDGTRGTSSCVIAGKYHQEGQDDGGDTTGIGIKIDNTQCFGHQVSFLFNAANPGGCFNCSSDTHAGVEDLTQIALLVRGDQTGSLAFEGMNQGAGGGAIVDLTGGHCAHIDSSTFTPQTAGAPAVHIVNGCVTTSGIRGNSGQASDWLIEKGVTIPVTATITGSVSEATTVYVEDPTTQLSCVNNLFLSVPCGNSIYADLAFKKGLLSQGSVPSCSTNCSSVTGTNTAMVVTTPASSVTSAAVSFNPAFASVPTCSVTRSTAGSVQAAITSVTATGLTIGYSAGVTSEKDYVLCISH